MIVNKLSRFSLHAIFALTLLSVVPDHARAQTYSVLHSLNLDDGWNAHSQLLLSGTVVYGTADGGGTSNKGTIFRLNTGGSGFSVIKTCTSEAGAPGIGLALSGTTLYGITGGGGASNCGTVFQIGTNGADFTVLKSFTGPDGRYPQGHLILSGTTLYGTTLQGGAANFGTVFKVNTDGSGFSVIRSFLGSDGYYPGTGLALSGSTLYGTSLQTPSGYGNIFKVNTDGSGFVVLKTFTGDDGNDPYGGLLLSGETLYGTTETGGGGLGTVYKINTDGSGFAMLKQFTVSSDGTIPVGDLVLSGTTLYGTASGGGVSPEGGVSPNGTIFKLGIDGSGFAVLKSFSGDDGASPGGGLTLSGNTLLGVTRGGGSYSNGVLFALSLPQPITLSPGLSPTGRFQLTFDGLAGKAYTILSSVDVAGPWSAVTNLVSTTDGVIDFEEPDLPVSQQRFYRVCADR